MLRGSLFTSALIIALAFGFDAHAQQSGGTDPVIPLEKLKHQFKFQSKNISTSDCRTRCRRPITVTDKIHCCTVCLEAQWICTILSCGCEVLLNKK